ncbi:flagellar type III secretion system protein FlhB [Paludibacterium sp. dN 18-1]|uniref:Flagellar type III secretion system protein FlhB n=1 Tax=Paludibacterium denitrificans TaxID=2675226 RepID=A0A844GBB8_9NEIS|nr:flagellar type III secretion system protein FlhB [Paludibacterium denitrificans]
MAETTSGDKTEKASQQKLRKARDNGQVIRSRDVATAIGIVVGLKLLLIVLPDWLQAFRSLFILSLANLHGDGGFDNAWSILFPASLWLLPKMLLPLFAIPVCIIIGSLIPGGWVFSTGHLLPRFNRLSPINFFERAFSTKNASQVGISLLKSVLIGLVLWYVVQANITSFLRLQRLPLGEAIVRCADLTLNAVLLLSMVFVVLALIDVPLQALLFLREQRMSKQEIKEEYKNSEGRPEVRQRIRQIQRQLAQRSIRKAVPTADVVIVNPTHYAVALKYDEERAEAPYVVAKGVDEMAFYIRQLATDHHVEVIALPPLARAIYNTSQVQQQIPAALYQAVAAVLTYVLQIQAFREGRRQLQPDLPTHYAIPEDFLTARQP